MKTRSAKLSEQFKRDGQHETPPASVNYPEAKSAPGFSLQSPGCRQSGQEVIPDKSANSSNSTNAAITPPPSANDAEIYHETVPFENDQILPNEFDQPVQSPSDDKSPPKPNHQVQPDSVLSFDVSREGLNYDPPCFHHETRPDNSTDFQRDPKTRIKFPKSSDVKRWKV